MGLYNYVKKCNNSMHAAHQSYMVTLNLGGASRLHYKSALHNQGSKIQSMRLNIEISKTNVI